MRVVITGAGTGLGRATAIRFANAATSLLLIGRRSKLLNEVSSIVAEERFWDLDMPIIRITTPHIPLPSAGELEDIALPSTDRIFETVRNEVD